MQTITSTNFKFPGQTGVYKGKVREVYYLENDLLVAVATDRLSAFDVVMPKGIPYKGQILNQLALRMMRATEDLVPNWMLASPDPNVTVGVRCEPFKVEMVGMQENDPFQKPIITPATKAEKGDHDEDISREAIIERGLVSEADYAVLEDYTRKLFRRGSELAAEKGLLLVDTKYEFGKKPDGTIVLIDEIHTPDSSRYFYAEGYSERQKKGIAQKQLSKEFVRQWLIQHGFQGLEGQVLPEMPDDYIQSVSERYIELYEKILGEPFVKADISDIQDRIEKGVTAYLRQLN